MTKFLESLKAKEINSQTHVGKFLITELLYSDKYRVPYRDSVHFRSVAQSCPTLSDPMDCSMQDLPVHHQLLAPHSSTLAWKIPWREEPGRLQSMRSLRVATTERLPFPWWTWWSETVLPSMVILTNKQPSSPGAFLSSTGLTEALCHHWPIAALWACIE